GGPPPTGRVGGRRSGAGRRAGAPAGPRDRAVAPRRGEPPPGARNSRAPRGRPGGHRQPRREPDDPGPAGRGTRRPRGGLVRIADNRSRDGRARDGREPRRTGRPVADDPAAAGPGGHGSRGAATTSRAEPRPVGRRPRDVSPRG